MEKQAANSDEDDRLSQLPQHILHQILCLLSQKEAVQTCVLSKSWRYVGPTRPRFEFRESYFNGNKDAFWSVLETSLQRYNDQNLSVHDFVLEVAELDSDLISFLENWVPVVALNMGVNKFSLSIHPDFFWGYFNLPSSLLEAESLEDLYLKGCNVDPMPVDKVLFKHLKRLSLKKVCISDETFEKIMSSCPLIEFMVLDTCEGLKTIKVNKLHNLKEFDFSDEFDDKLEDDLIIDIDVPNLKTISIKGCLNWYHHRKCFPHLKSLHLQCVRLSAESFDSFSINFPCLEKLDLKYCFGFEEFKISSRTIKYLIVMGMDRSIKADIDATNILYFEFAGAFIPSISFGTTSSEWDSRILLWCNKEFNTDALPWFLKLNALLKALSQSEISLNFFLDLLTDQHVEDISLILQETYGGIYEPCEVERLGFGAQPCSSLTAFLNCLFCVCRPKSVYSQNSWLSKGKELNEFLWKILVMERGIVRYFWQRELEKVNMEAFHMNEKEWHCLPDCPLPDEQHIIFRLKWRESYVSHASLVIESEL